MKTAQGFASIIKMQASRYEQLIKPENRPIVEKYLERADPAAADPDPGGHGNIFFTLVKRTVCRRPAKALML